MVRISVALAIGAVVLSFVAPGAQGPSPAAVQVVASASGWELVVLGIAQDAGIPQLGCDQPLCRSIRDGKRKPERVASLGLVNRTSRRSYLFDATPDLVAQLGTLNGGDPPTAIFLTHAHIGHYTGLMYLGRESLDTRNVPVYATQRMVTYLTSNGPWSQLVSRSNIALRTLAPDTAVTMTPDADVRVTAFLVPHRDEFSDTVGYLIERGEKRALYIPDIDQWTRWSRSIRELVDTVDYAFLDGTFASADEIPGRAIADIPHPLIPVTRKMLLGTRAQVFYIHLNHTNREIGVAKDLVKDGQRFGF